MLDYLSLSSNSLFIAIVVLVLTCIAILFILRRNLHAKLKFVSPEDRKLSQRTKYFVNDHKRYSKYFFLWGILVSLGFSILTINWVVPNRPEALTEVEAWEELFPVDVKRTQFYVQKAEAPPIKELTKVIKTDVNNAILVLTEEEEVVSEEVEMKEAEGTESTQFILPSPSKGEAPKVEPIIEEPKEDKIFIIVEEMPRFPGCEDEKMTKKEKEECSNSELMKFLSRTVKYPSLARENEIEGTVTVQFIVNKEGFIEHINVVREPHNLLGEAAKEAIESMNKMKKRWSPGKQRGRAVNVQYTVPIKFSASR